MAIKPRGEVERSNNPKIGFVKIGEPQFEILAWCRDEHAKLPPEQVHFAIHWPAQLADLPPLAIRFKSPDTLGFFIEELMKYRRIVWPDCERVTGEAPVEMPENAQIIRGFLREMECFDEKMFSDAGGFRAVAQLENMVAQIRRLEERAKTLEKVGDGK